MSARALLLVIPMALPQIQVARVHSPHGAPAEIVINAHDPANGQVASVSTQVTCDLSFTYSVDNSQGAAPVTVQLCMPGSYQAVEVLSPLGAQMGFATFAMQPVSVVVPAGTVIPPTTHTVKGLIGIWQSVLGVPGSFPEFEGQPGTQVRMAVRFPAVLNTQQSGPCIIKQEVSIAAAISVRYG